MKNINNEKFWRRLLNYISFVLIFALIEFVIYHVLTKIGIEEYWLVIPVVFYLFSMLINNFWAKSNLNSRLLSAVSLGALIVLYFYISIEKINLWVTSNAELLSFLIVLIYFINLILVNKAIKVTEVDSMSNDNNSLFNLFYINTSKVHEIVMLIDNKIMKTVEKEQISEELLKYNSSLNLNVPDTLTTGIGYLKEDNSKKKVYESFDVKNTKSIMLRKIYETIQANKQQSRNTLKTGDLVVFENIELRPRNIDDTVLVLNILRDSNIKNSSNDNLEINLNKMMDKMLDDFTIDYIFSYKTDDVEEEFIVQLPFKNNDNFENGYQHNDLQLGKLSLMGIYRGEIDYSQRESTSSKFLDLMSKSYQNELKEGSDAIMKSSNASGEAVEIAFDFSHNKLSEKLNLIDVIAIIQELNIDRKN
ncbi:hypothetical protein GCM10008014_09370 [Paenibacillus silvae]|uniref:Uncharacterized protein n=1 Tax=Paenibacillus silvae TaxID=1325358 RepID=A0ABQ1Z3S8_9BACL|nr:hypothetical protein [Paenibacillus silvae]GGH46618.1 hypothetical protein GCM10008014_09370 [Paenibacillus silvae]